MAAIEPPFVCQGRTDHPAQLFRVALAGASGAPYAAGGTSPQGGVDPYMGQAMVVTGLASLNVQIGTGLVFIPNTTAWNGMYAGYNTATFNVAIPAVSTTQWRSDYIVAQCIDPGDATANWNVFDVAGVFSSSSPGALPALPANSIPLAIIRVVPNMTVTNGGGTVVDARVWNGLKGIWPTTSTARPSLTCPNGTMWYEADTFALGVIINGAYAYLNTASPAAQDPWHNFNPLAAGWSVPAGGFAKYRKTFDNEVQLTAAIATTVGTSSTWTTITASPLPAGYRPPSNHIFAAATDAESASPSQQSPRAQLLTTGHIQLQYISTSALFAEFEARIPLDV